MLIIYEKYFSNLSTSGWFIRNKKNNIQNVLFHITHLDEDVDYLLT